VEWIQESELWNLKEKPKRCNEFEIISNQVVDEEEMLF
jgi:hypothetical protein